MSSPNISAIEQYLSDLRAKLKAGHKLPKP